MSARPPVEQSEWYPCPTCGALRYPDLAHDCMPAADGARPSRGRRLGIAVCVVLLVLLATGKVSVAADPDVRLTRTALRQAVELVEHHPAWRDGKLRRGSLPHGCSFQVRVLRNGTGYAAVSCRWLVAVAQRDARGRWLA